MPRIAVVDERLCFPLKCNIECVRGCPINRVGKDCLYLYDRKKAKAKGHDGAIEQAPVHVTKREYSREERENGLAEVDPELCTGCGICPKVCPFHALTIINLAEAKPEDLVYSYGYNSFGLYRLALPKKGLTAIVGENGCGKTTNVRLLAGLLEPQRTPTKEIEEFFRGGRGSFVVKPQELAAPKESKSVGELLEGVDESGRLADLVKLFDLEKLLQRSLGQLSGGELQRVVVAAALARDKENYFLDEPFSFLDYVYRIRLTEFLKEHFSEKRVLLVDHDLSLLSYVCMQSYILYGRESAYGIVSQVYSTDRAVNMFLEGFIGPENVRFRDEAISYRQYPESEHKREAYSIGAMEASKGAFVVRNPSQISLLEGEVVGIAGPNGIGKSALCESVFLHSSGRAAFKPQLLDRSHQLVGESLSASGIFPENALKTMDLRRLEFLRQSDLSGGQLQRLKVFECLNQEKSLYILDEPTNMLDASARITLSKVVRERAQGLSAVLVVDHDLEFLYNTVDRVVVMEGVPAVEGRVAGIFDKDEGIRMLMRQFDLSYRRDGESRRLKLNKKGSKKDAELKGSGKYIER
ncbi:MAG: ATP-binding cassette domain-containing protein, partial [Candidatus Micrarchaeota archaeon]